MRSYCKTLGVTGQAAERASLANASPLYVGPFPSTVPWYLAGGGFGLAYLPSRLCQESSRKGPCRALMERNLRRHVLFGYGFRKADEP